MKSLGTKTMKTTAIRVNMGLPNDKQQIFLDDEKHKYLGFGGARGGGKSWAVRCKAIVYALKYGGIKMLIVRRTYPELTNNHILPLKKFFVSQGFGSKYVKYNDKEKRFTFFNGSSINFMYCQRDEDLDRLQGTEWDVIFLDEATQLSEKQCTDIAVCCRGVNNFPKQVCYTCNPGGQSHGYFKRIFIDRNYKNGENADDYKFIQSLITDNYALMDTQPDYIKQLEILPPRLRDMWLYGKWDIFEGMFFEDFQPDPPASKIVETGMTADELRKAHRYCHVIEPFDVKNMNIYRSYDFGYNKPFSCAWWAVDKDGVIYRILEYYGCTETPDEGIRKTPDEQFKHIREIENEHPYLKGKKISGVADPAIWDASMGISVAETAEKYGIYFEKGDNKRIAGWMQCHYRLAFDENGYSMMYVFNNCKAFIRTVPTLMYSDTMPEDLNTKQEAHAADEWRYFCMTRPIAPRVSIEQKIPDDDPLELYKRNQGRKTYSENIMGN